MPIDIHTFDCDTYIFDNKQLKKITLLDKKKKPHISLEFNSPLVALWSPTKHIPIAHLFALNHGMDVAIL